MYRRKKFFPLKNVLRYNILRLYDAPAKNTQVGNSQRRKVFIILTKMQCSGKYQLYIRKNRRAYFR